jgi:hypothetical protein
MKSSKGRLTILKRKLAARQPHPIIFGENIKAIKAEIERLSNGTDTHNPT